ncbi:MAG: molybdopterin cofactor-binding domain-containing protein, partial [Planctomycetota bacterium]
RPMAAARFRGTVSEGKIAALDLRVASPGLRSSALRRAFHAQGDVADFFDKFGATGAMDQPYKIKHYRVTACPVPRLLPVGWWRSVGESQNSFFHESAIDELAHAAREDPLAMRLALLDHEPGRQVLAMVAKMSQWETPLPEGHGRGVAFALSSGAATAQVIEVSRQGDAIKIEKVFAAVDVGVALDPRNIEAQVQSSSLFGLGAAMHGEITVAQGKVAERNFDDYLLLPINLAPDVTVAIYESEDEIFGVGESATPTSAPALGNAIFAATGRRIRDLPFGKSIKFVS